LSQIKQNALLCDDPFIYAGEKDCTLLDPVFNGPFGVYKAYTKRESQWV
jgi:hypothetical protein